MGCNCGKNKKYPKKKSSRMPVKKKKQVNEQVNKQTEMSPNDRRVKILKLQNAKKLKQIRRQQFEWERRANNENL